MTIAYADFIARRKARIYESGPAITPSDLHRSLKPFQVELVIWAARVGRAAIWADTGLGKTRMQLEWARSVAETALIVAPLAVAQQTIAEALGLDIRPLDEWLKEKILA